jgi:hypothetical protein
MENSTFEWYSDSLGRNALGRVRRVVHPPKLEEIRLNRPLSTITNIPIVGFHAYQIVKPNNLRLSSIKYENGYFIFDNSVYYVEFHIKVDDEDETRFFGIETVPTSEPIPSLQYKSFVKDKYVLISFTKRFGKAERLRLWTRGSVKTSISELNVNIIKI